MTIIKYALRAEHELIYLLDLNDITLYAGADTHLNSLLDIADMSSRDIQMEFAKLHSRHPHLKYPTHELCKEPMLALVI